MQEVNETNGRRRYIFRNIRYAAPPVGELRWAKPAPPPVNATLQDGSYGPKCVQSAINGLNLLGPGNASPIGAAVNQLYVDNSYFVVCCLHADSWRAA